MNIIALTLQVIGFFVRGRSQAQGYFEEPLEPKAVISFMPYEKMEIVALMFSIGKEILEKM